MTGDLSREVDAIHSVASKQIDIELAVFADGDADRATRDGIFGEGSACRDSANLVGIGFSEPERTVSARNDAVWKSPGARGDTP